MRPSLLDLSLCHWLLCSSHLFVFHIVTAVYCKSDSYFPAFSSANCVCTTVNGHLWGHVSSIRAWAGRLPCCLSEFAAEQWPLQCLHFYLCLSLTDLCICHNKSFSLCNTFLSYLDKFKYLDTRCHYCTIKRGSILTQSPVFIS